MRQKCGRRKTCRIFSAYFQLIVVYCIYKLKKAEGDLSVNILIVADEPPARPCRGDAASLHRLAVILLDNAIKYAGTGGWPQRAARRF